MRANQSSPFEDLFQKRRGDIKPGLGPVKKAFDQLHLERVLEKPHALIAGTNGKGTVSGFLWSLLQHNSGPSGLYTSPHVHDFGERFFVDGQIATELNLLTSFREIESGLSPDSYEQLSFFDISTLLAFKTFDRLDVSSYVLEVGLGGRWDSTNICRPSVTVITSIGLDHEAYLGSGFTNIAREKAGILRPGIPLVLGSKSGIPQEAEEMILSIAEERAVPVIRVGEDICYDQSGVSFKGATLAAPQEWKNWPEIYKHNFTVAVAAASCITGEQVEPEINAIWERARRSPPFQGRMQHGKIEGLKGRVLLDVAHNDQGMKALQEHLNMTGAASSLSVVCLTMMQDKDAQTIVNMWKNLGCEVIVFQNPDLRSVTGNDLQLVGESVTFFESWGETRDYLLREFHNLDIMICGSIIGLAEILREFTPDGFIGENVKSVEGSPG